MTIHRPVNSTLITWVIFVFKKNNFFFKCTHENALVLKSINKVEKKSTRKGHNLEI